MTETTERDQAYFDIFVTALEGGIGYWSVCHEYHWQLAGAEGSVSETSDILGFYAEVKDSEEPSVFRVDRDVIAKGVRLFIGWAKDGLRDGYIKRAAVDLDWANWDDLDVDAEIADMIVQFGLFDKVVYG